MWGVKMQVFKSQKVLAVGQTSIVAYTLHFFVAEGHKQKDVDLVHYCLKYDNAAMNCRHAKKY